jgi:hypothetical protein
MCKLHRVLTSIAVLLAASGCATSSVDKDFSLAQHPQDGIVVVSVSHDLNDAVGNAKAIFYYTSQESDANRGQLESKAESFPGISKRSEFGDVNGRLLVFNLPQGAYKLTSWQISSGNLYVRPRNEPTPLSFSVKAGEVKYLGNLHAHLKNGNNLVGLPVLAGGYPEIRDERMRDITLLQERFPQFKDKVIVDLLSLGPWVNPSVSSK